MNGINTKQLSIRTNNVGNLKVKPFIFTVEAKAITHFDLMPKLKIINPNEKEPNVATEDKMLVWLNEKWILHALSNTVSSH